MLQWILATTLTLISITAYSDKKQALSQILTHTFKYTNATPSTINVTDLKSGCPQRDCIRSIDHPRFTRIENTRFMHDEDQLIMLNHNGITRAYPKKILNFREIVNDRFGNTPVVVTYCPLCASGIAFIARINGQTTEFGISGMLYNNDLVMYDRQTNQLWSQILGQAIVGVDARSTASAIAGTTYHLEKPEKIITPTLKYWHQTLETKPISDDSLLAHSTVSMTIATAYCIHFLLKTSACHGKRWYMV